MRATRIIPNLRVIDIAAAKDFYTGFLGLESESLGLDWVTRFTSSDGAAQVQLLTEDMSAPEDPVVSVHTPDVEEAYAQAQRLGYEIVHPLTTEPWGVRRFLVRAPDGNVLNIVNHRD